MTVGEQLGFAPLKAKSVAESQPFAFGPACRFYYLKSFIPLFCLLYNRARVLLLNGKRKIKKQKNK